MDRYPTAEEGLKALVEAPAGEENKWRGPYIKLLRADPWKSPYQYRCLVFHHPTVLISGREAPIVLTEAKARRGYWKLAG